MNTVTVKINGMEYNLKGKEEDEYLLKVSEYVDGKFKEVSSNNNKLSISSVAVLSALNIADELFKCNNEVEDLLKEKNSLEERNLTLKERIREIKQEVEETIKNKNQEMASLKEMLYSNLTSSDENNKKLSMSLLNTQDEFLKEKKENKKLNAKIFELNEDIANKVSLEEYNNVLDSYNALKENVEQISLEKSGIENMLEEFKININYIELENKNLKDSENVLKEVISSKEDEIEEYKSKASLDEEEAKILKDKILELEAVIAKGKEQRKALLNRDKAIKFQLQNFKYKVLDLEKKLIDLQVELAVERRKANPLLK